MKLGEMVLEILNGGEKVHEDFIQATLYITKHNDPVEAWRVGYLCAMDRVIEMVKHYNLGDLDLEKKI